MKSVRIIRDWEWPDLMRQTPESSGIWRDCAFTYDAVEECDFVVILNRVPASTTVNCPAENILTIIQEPPVREYEWLRQGFATSHLILTPDVDFVGTNVIHTHGSLPWHVDRSYDQLKSNGRIEKTKRLSWIMSDKALRQGHRDRLRFLKRMRGRVGFDLMGRGFAPLLDKWAGLAPYRYSLAIENYSGPHYWTEKLSDCFLARTMPIYYGCTNLGDYFPAESFVQIDIEDPEAPNLIGAVTESDLSQKSRDAIEYARELVLDTHQFFPFVTSVIHDAEVGAVSRRSYLRTLRGLPSRYPVPVRAGFRRAVRRRLRNLRRGR